MIQKYKKHKYIKIRLIGKGSFGSCFLVKRQQDYKRFVIKQIKIMNSKDKLNKALNEVQILNKLCHNNHDNNQYICEFKKFWTDELNDYLYILMDYYELGDLNKFINKRKIKQLYLKESSILHYFTMICLGLSYIHHQKILHRDLKPSNIFLSSYKYSKHNIKKILKIGDLGIAKLLSYTMELANTRIGTPYYLSPEVIRGEAYNYSSDIWSLGCILYELTALKHAFTGKNISQLAIKIIKNQRNPIPSKYSLELHNLIDNLLQTDAKKRLSIDQILSLPIIKNKLHLYDQNHPNKNNNKHHYNLIKDKQQPQQQILSKIKKNDHDDIKQVSSIINKKNNPPKLKYLLKHQLYINIIILNQLHHHYYYILINLIP